METERADGVPLRDTVTNLQQQLGKKQTFETAAASLAHILADHYPSASASDQKQMYTAVCRAATLLQTRYTAPGFWMAGLKLFKAAQQVMTRPEEKENMQAYISRAYENIGEEMQKDELPSQLQTGNAQFLFEGQLTVGPEPPPPAWMVAQNLLRALVSERERHRSPVEERSESNSHSGAGSSSQDSPGTDAHQQMEEWMAQEIQELMQRVPGLDDFGSGLEEAIEATLQEIGGVPGGTPPASKEVVAKLPVIDVTEAELKRIGKGTECAVCREDLVVGDKMQEMPCKHLFHPDCLKPWLDEHNSCPICRYELRTDNHDYESKKERDKEFEEERKGAANALRGGEFMYV